MEGGRSDTGELVPCSDYCLGPCDERPLGTFSQQNVDRQSITVENESCVDDSRVKSVASADFIVINVPSCASSTVARSVSRTDYTEVNTNREPTRWNDVDSTDQIDVLHQVPCNSETTALYEKKPKSYHGDPPWSKHDGREAVTSPVAEQDASQRRMLQETAAACDKELPVVLGAEQHQDESRPSDASSAHRSRPECLHHKPKCPRGSICVYKREMSDESEYVDVRRRRLKLRLMSRHIAAQGCELESMSRCMRREEAVNKGSDSRCL